MEGGWGVGHAEIEGQGRPSVGMGGPAEGRCRGSRGGGSRGGGFQG